METFAYAHPATKQEVFGLLGADWDDAAVLAGGTDIISLMKEHVVIPKRVISIRGIKEWGGISQRQNINEWRIGALVTLEELQSHPWVSKVCPALALAARGISSPQMRNMGTVGGDLCQRPRCWYFRNGFGLLARDAKGNSLVPSGENKYHAIFGNDGPAYFVSPSSLAPPLIALGAHLHLEGPTGGRDVNAADFFVIPKNDSDRENVLKPNEIITEIVIPPDSWQIRSATYEVRQRTLMDWPLATASVALKMNGGTVTSAKIVLGHVAPIPWQADDAAKWLVGKKLTEETAAAAGDAAVKGAKPLSQNEYKVQLARVSVKRALLAAAKEGA
jgi:xanthine dehydrogenase YagS FAD-binding subunit